MKCVTLENHDAVGVITVNNPPVNALSQAVRAGLLECLGAALADRHCEAIVLECSGRTFIAGADIREFGQPPAAPYLPDVVERIEAADKPVIAAIHGTALGGGLEIAMGCHYRIAQQDARLGLPEVKLGLLPGATGTQRLPRLVGVEAALDMMLSGEPVSASAALDSGLLDAVVENGLGTAARDLAANKAQSMAGQPRRTSTLAVPAFDPATFATARQRIAAKSRGLLSPELIIRCVEAAAELDYEAGCKVERKLFLECRDSPQSAGLRHAFFAERQAAKIPGIAPDGSQRTLEHAAVIGAGTMGAGIAYALLVAGLPVRLLDNEDEGLERGRRTIAGLFAKGVERGRLSEELAARGLERLTLGTDIGQLGDCDLVIEAVFENMAVKKKVFAALDDVCRKGAILASNTSTLDIDEIAAATSRPADVVGLHFFSPAHVMRLLEVVRGASTADDVLATSIGLAKRLQKIAVVVGNCFGFVGNRMLYSYGRENQLLLLEGAAPEFIDRVLTDWGMAMGPNAVGDLAGLDVGYRVRQERSDLPDDPRFYRVADMLAEQGRYGQKTGRGIYRYPGGARTPTPDPEVRVLIRDEARRLGVEQRDIDAQEIVDRCIYGLVTEGARILEDRIALRSSDIDVVWINGYGFPRQRGGPMHFADQVGAATVLARVREFRERFGPMYWEPPKLLEQLARQNAGFADT